MRLKSIRDKKCELEAQMENRIRMLKYKRLSMMSDK